MEFQENLNNKVTNLDELIVWHNKYLNRVLFRYRNIFFFINQNFKTVIQIVPLFVIEVHSTRYELCLLRSYS